MDKITPERRSANMARIRSAHTKPEMIVRRMAHRLGFRFRMHRRNLPGKPDLVFAGRKKIVFVHGCYWHGHGCKVGGTGAKSNQAYWGPKIARNRERDDSAIIALKASGWNVLVVWECETRDETGLAKRLRRFLKSAGIRAR
jgi:DNA mismatch endonuclease (patch repair protein)